MFVNFMFIYSCDAGPCARPVSGPSTLKELVQLQPHPRKSESSDLGWDQVYAFKASLVFFYPWRSAGCTLGSLAKHENLLPFMELTASLWT